MLLCRLLKRSVVRMLIIVLRQCCTALIRYKRYCSDRGCVIDRFLADQ